MGIARAMEGVDGDGDLVVALTANLESKPRYRKGRDGNEWQALNGQYYPRELINRAQTQLAGMPGAPATAIEYALRKNTGGATDELRGRHFAVAQSLGVDDTAAQRIWDKVFPS